MSNKNSTIKKPTSVRMKIDEIKRKKLGESNLLNLDDFRQVKHEAFIKTILVVDDDEVIRNALKRILEKDGYCVVLAEDGMELSKILESRRLDLILLDVNLPWVDGFELCQIIKGDPIFREVPLILISGRKTADDIHRGFEAGCTDYISKPFDIQLMKNTIDRAFR